MRGSRRNTTAAIAVLLLMAAATAGLYHLMHLRFDSGDVYPTYSSFRPDPLGTQALYDSLALMDGMRAVRTLKTPLGRELEKLARAPEQTAVIYIARSAQALVYMPSDQAEALSTFASTGGRVVLAVFPQPATKPLMIDKWIKERRERACKNARDNASASRQDDNSASKEQPDANTGDEPMADPDVQSPENSPQDKHDTEDTASARQATDDESSANSLCFEQDYGSYIRKKPFYRNFGVLMDIANTTDFGYMLETGPRAIRMIDDNALPATVAWHSAAFATGATDNWRTAYSLDGRPVAVQRALGRGSVVLTTDAYHLSNEALMMARHPGLLAWLVGADTTTVIFEETHMGIKETEGVASLGRKYRLHWLALALLVLALLFVWRSATSLVPPAAYARGGAQAPVMSGKDYISGMASLMRRNVPASRLMSTCVEQWRKSFAHRRMRFEDESARIDAVLKQGADGGKGSPGPVGMYTKITKIISERKH